VIVMSDSLRSPWAWLPPAGALALAAGIVATGTNRALFLWLNHAGQAVGDPVWFHLTMLGDGAVALALVLPWIRRAPRLFWAALLAAVVAGLWTQVTKEFVDVPRPLSVFAVGEFHQAGPAYRRVSFPSGHAAAAFGLAGIWVMGTEGGRLWRVLLLLLASLIGLSRIMVGVHWPLDILWGMLGGWLGAWSGLALQARSQRHWPTSGWAGMLAGAVLTAVAVSLVVSRHIGIPAVLPAQRLLGATCLAWGAWEMGAVGALRDAWLRRWPRRVGLARLVQRAQKRRPDG
jgi:membrane-associated phospholipid phosphatase